MSQSGTDRLFVDVVEIYAQGGRGGDGCVSFRREKYVPKGGPDGGDGGHGGSVILVADEKISTLLQLSGRHHWRADSGKPGSGSNRHGKSASDLIVPVPAGTLVYDADSGRLLKDLVDDGDTAPVARGGRGGRGNARFASPTNQAPREFSPGRAGEERKLRLELKLIADVGLVGLPNAGKSTMLSRLTNAHPRIAPYPFTTITPQLGIAELPGFRRLVFADIPGLIEGAHEGVGLGDAFLRHIERTRVIAHIVDMAPPEGSPEPLEAYRVVREELNKYSPALAARREIVIANKIDVTDAADGVARFRAAVGRPVIPTSGVTGAGMREFLEAVWSAVEEAKKEQVEKPRELIDFGPVTSFDDEEAFDFGVDEPEATDGGER
ncbi:MAG: GTPase ObgE [Phycisphaerales bacterium]|nr:GTPase ObgE [Phycisphaerales bacterium]